MDRAAVWRVRQAKDEIADRAPRIVCDAMFGGRHREAGVIALTATDVWTFRFVATPPGPQLHGSFATPLAAVSHVTTKGGVLARAMQVVLHLHNGQVMAIEVARADGERLAAALTVGVREAARVAATPQAPVAGVVGDAPSRSAEPVVQAAPDRSRGDEAPAAIQVAIASLDAMVGLNGVKQEIRALVTLLQVRAQRLRRGLPVGGFSPHLAFTGSGGTGKRTVAALVADIYRVFDVVSRGQLITVAATSVPAGISEAVAAAAGGVLYISDAGRLAEAPEPHRQRAIEELNRLSALPPTADLAVILAGNARGLQQLLHSDAALSSCFGTTIRFADPADGELVELFTRFCERAAVHCDETALAAVRRHVAARAGQGGPQNADLVEEMVAAGLRRRAARLAQPGTATGDPIHPELMAVDLEGGEG